MKRFFKRFSHKNEKILQRELALAHTVIVLLAIGLIAVLLTVYGQSDIFDGGLILLASTLLGIVAIISTVVVSYIVVSKRK